MSWNVPVFQASGLLSLGQSSFAHGDSMVVSGSSFGTKSPAAPLLWDDCNHAQSFATRWDGGLPSSASGYNIDYYVPGSGNCPSVALPHSNAGTKVLAAGHFQDVYDGGRNAGPILSIPVSNGDALYVYFLHRRSPSYNNSGDNYKIWYWDGSSASWYGSSTDGYIEYKDSTIQYMLWNNGSYSFRSSDGLNSAGDWMAEPAADIDSAWVAQEWFWGMDARADSGGGDGFCYVIDDNADRVATTQNVTSSPRLQNIETDKLIFWYEEQTLPSNSGTVHACIGGYTANYQASNWRYWADLYIDDTWSRVVLTDNATYDSATEVVPQIPTAWAASEITVTVNKGRLATGTAHVFVFDSANARQYIGTVELD